MNRTSSPVFAWFGLAALLAVGCQDEPPQASSRLSRPSGLAYVARSGARADIFIADAEARGVRVLQLAKLSTTDGRIVDDQLFLAGPVIFFPLVIPAFEFPTAVSPTEDGNRLYVLSPVGPSMHLLDVREAPYGQSAQLVEGYVPLADFDLEAMSAALGLSDLVGPDAIPVDIDVLPSAAGEDRVAVTYDRVLSADSLVVVFGVTAGDFAMSVVSTATVSAGPRATQVRRASPAGLLVSSASTSTVSFLPFTATATAGLFGTHQGLFAGGPSINVVDAGEAGVLALRLDRASVVLFEATSGALVRSTRTSTSPFTTAPDLDDSDRAGRIDTFPRALKAGAHGLVSSLADSMSFPTGTATDAVALVHVDGTMSFLVGRPLALSLANLTSVQSVTRRTSDGLDLVGCTERDDQAGDPFCPLDLPAACTEPVLSNEVARLSSVRVEYQGALAQRDGGELRAATSTNALARRLVDPSAPRFGTRQVVPGNLVLLQYRGAPSCDSEEIVEWVSTASVAAVSSTASELVVILPEGSPFLGADPCDGALPLRRYQVYPVGQVVVTERRVDETTASISGVFDVELGDDGVQKVVLGTGPVRGTVLAPSGFRCETGPVLDGPAPCDSDFDCGGASCRTAEAASGSETETTRACGRFCATCTDLDGDCFGSFVVRRCSALELGLEPASVTATNPRALVADPVTTLPEDIVFSPIRESWIFSLPGARAMAEVRTLVAEDGTLVFGGTPEIRASTEAR